MNPWRARSGGAGALFAALLLAGIGLRAWRVGQPDLWGDEILYLRMCRPEMSAGQVVDAHLSSYKYIGHLPSTAILTNLGLKLQGVRTKDQVTPLNARLPSVVMGGVTLALLALWVFQLSGSRLQALLALGITAFSFVHIWYSREAYYYPGELLYAALVLVTGTPLLRGGLGRGRAAALIGLFHREKAKELREAMIAEFCSWYETTALPSFVPEKPQWADEAVPSVAGSVLCHVSVAKWQKASGFEAFSTEKKERCRRLAADGAAKIVELLNRRCADPKCEFAPIKAEVKACIDCHGPRELGDAMGKMQCSVCHDFGGAKHPTTKSVTSAPK